MHSIEAGVSLPSLFAGDGQSGWSRGMRGITRALLAPLILPHGPIVEVGCGGGDQTLALREWYPARTVVGADLHVQALGAAMDRAPGPWLRADLQQMPLATESVALLVALDSLDQQGVDLPLALAELYRVLQPGGALLLRVSAHPWLEGPHDQAFNTGRRFTAAGLQQQVRAAGFQLSRLTYANLLLAPPIVLMRLAQRAGLLPFNANHYASDAGHEVLAQTLGLEALWLARGDLPLGMSICLVARRGRWEWVSG